LAILAAVFGLAALPRTDWEILSTKHYWSAAGRYYGGFAWPIVETPGGYRTPQKEGLANYTNLAALAETVSPKQAQNHVQGYPGTERLAVSFFVYVLLHLTGRTVDIWSLFWLLNVLLWLAAIALTHQTARLFYSDRLSPWFAAILVALYPVLTLTFNTIKVQPLGAVYLLAGMYIFERSLKLAGAAQQLLGLTALLFLGLFANGGWFYAAAFIFLRAWWLDGRARWQALASLGVAFVVANLALAALAQTYHLPSVEQRLGFSFRGMARESGAWILAWIRGGSVAGLKFANFPGTTFFSGFLPLVVRSFLRVHGLVVGLALLGAWVERRARIFAILTVPMLLVGHSGDMVAAWVYHYGYMSFPAGLMAILGAAGGLGWLANRRGWAFPLLAFALVAAIGGGFGLLKRQAGIYFGGDESSYQRVITIYDGDNDTPLRY
jgi:hypothetical protein